MANPETPKLDRSEEQLMDDITKDNRLMRRKLNESVDQGEGKKERRGPKRIAVKVYVKDPEEIPNMRKRVKELESLQELYLRRIHELETQLNHYSNFQVGNTVIDIKDSSTLSTSPSPMRFKRSIPSGKESVDSMMDSKSSHLSSSSDFTTDTTISSVTSPTESTRRSRQASDKDRTKLLALYDYIPASDAKGRLAFKEGEVLLLVNMKSRSGWWVAELNGKTGKIPSNYVEQLDPSKAFKVRVTKNFDSQQPGDMSIQRGHTLTILKRQENGWYLGEKGTKHGFFPSSHVERIAFPVS